MEWIFDGVLASCDNVIVIMHGMLRLDSIRLHVVLPSFLELLSHIGFPSLPDWKIVSRCDFGVIQRSVRCDALRISSPQVGVVSFLLRLAHRLISLVSLVALLSPRPCPPPLLILSLSQDKVFDHPTSRRSCRRCLPAAVGRFLGGREGVWQR